MKFPIYFAIDACLMVTTIPLLIPLWKRLDAVYRQAAAFSMIFMVTLSSFCQYLSLIHFQAWRVDPEVTYIIPLYLGGAPIEEYLFWWFFGLLMIELYLWPKLWFEMMDKRAKESIHG